MIIRELEIGDFRSWREGSFQLGPGVTIFVGRNGYGKTNILEVVGYVATLGSHRVSSDSPLIRQGCTQARIKLTALNEGRELTLYVLLKEQGTNLAQINRTRLKTPKELLGIVKTVLFSPEDLALVRGEPAERRTYLDAIIATRRPRLAGVYADYKKVLRQRNTLLRNASTALRRGYGSSAEDTAAALATLDAWDGQLAHLGAQIIFARCALVEELSTYIHDAYAGIAPESRPAAVRYISTLSQLEPDVEVLEATMLQDLSHGRVKDIDRGMSLIGPHRDDLEILLGDYPAKGFASHGETWSMVLALRLGQFHLLRHDGTDPVLLLDDVFAELDAKRRRMLVEAIADVEQVLITAAVVEDLPTPLVGAGSRIIQVGVENTEEGRISVVVEGEDNDT